MVSKRDGQIIETTQQARQAERGPTVRNLLVASTSLAIVALAIIWFIFFRTCVCVLPTSSARPGGLSELPAELQQNCSCYDFFLDRGILRACTRADDL